MPSKVIAIVYQNSSACKIYEGIMFTNKDANIINDENNPE